jgi:hypothetical protein
MPRRPCTLARAAGVALAVALSLGAASTAATAQARVDRRLPADRDVSLRVFNLAGSVRVIGWDRDSVAVTGTVGPGATLMMGGTRQAMKLAPEHPVREDAPPSALEIRVPRAARVWVKTESAPVTVEGVRGGLDLYTVSGAITVTGDPRELRAESMDGDVTVTGTPAWARLKTATGDVALRGGGDDVGLTSVSGALAVSGGAVERARLETVSGAVTFAATMVRGGSYDVETHGGRVELHVPAALGVDLEATTLHGAIDGPVVTPDSRGRDGRTVTLLTGDASARVAVRTFKGPIHLRRP